MEMKAIFQKNHKQALILKKEEALKSFNLPGGVPFFNWQHIAVHDCTAFVLHSLSESTM